MPFKKGQPRPKGAGRKKGSRNKSTIEKERDFAQIVQWFFDKDYWENLRRRVLSGRAPHAEKFLLEKAYGKAPLKIDLGDEARDALKDAAAAFTSGIASVAARLGKK